MSAPQQVDELLKESGAVLIRDHKHEVWRLPNGNRFVRAKTPSDRREDRHGLSDLRRALGIENTGGGIGERRKRRPKVQGVRPGLDLTRTPGLNGGLAEQLIATGLVEAAESSKARAWATRWKVLARYYRLLALKGAAEIVRLEARSCPCWWCWLKAKLTVG